MVKEVEEGGERNYISNALDRHVRKHVKLFLYVCIFFVLFLTADSAKRVKNSKGTGKGIHWGRGEVKWEGFT